MLGAMTVHAFGDKVPQIDPGVFVHVDATVTGDVIIEEGATVWPSASLRGDVDQIVVGSLSSCQDCVVMHASPGQPVRIGSGCAVGHGAILHGCVVGDDCMIGIHATLLDGCEVGEHSIVAANALLLEGRVYPPRSLLVGSPARVVRELTDEDIERIGWVRDRYAARGRLYAEQGYGADLSAFLRGRSGAD